MTGYADIFASVAKGADWYEEFLNTFLPALDDDIAALLGLAATSSTSLSIATGSTGAITLSPATTLFRVGAPVRIRRDSDASTFMLGAATAASAGSVTVNVTGTGGSGGPYTNWIVTVDLTAEPQRMSPRSITGADTVAASDLGRLLYLTGTFTLSYAAVATLAEGFWFAFDSVSGVQTHDPSGAETIDGAATIVTRAGMRGIVAVRNGALVVVASKGYGLPLQVDPTIRTANFDAVAGYIYMVNTAGGAVTATLDASPAQGARVGFIDATGSFATYNLTLSRNGNTIDGSAANFACNVSGLGHTLDFNDTANDWRVS